MSLEYISFKEIFGSASSLFLTTTILYHREKKMYFLLYDYYNISLEPNAAALLRIEKMHKFIKGCTANL